MVLKQHVRLIQNRSFLTLGNQQKLLYIVQIQYINITALDKKRSVARVELPKFNEIEGKIHFKNTVKLSGR